MRFNEKEFYPNNWAEFVHKNVLPEMLKYVVETHVSDLENIQEMRTAEYQRDANGEYRLMVTYLDQNGKEQSKVLAPAITNRVLDLCNAEIVKHFLYTKNGQDVSINQMRFNNDKLELNLVDGDHIVLDLKPLVPRINVIGENGEVLQKNLNYHINDNCIIFVDLEGNETKLDFNKLLTVDAFKQAKAEIIAELQRLNDVKLDKVDFETAKNKLDSDIAARVTKEEFNQFKDDNQAALDLKDNIVDVNDKLKTKVDKVDYNKFVDDTRSELDTKADKVKMAAELDKKEDKTDHDADVDRLQTQINDRSTHAETDQAVTETVRQIKDWANPLHDDILSRFNNYVSKVLFDQVKSDVENLTITKLDKSEYDKDKANYIKTSDLVDYVTKELLNSELVKHYTKEQADELLDGKADKQTTQTALDSKVNASDLVADYYNKTDVDALVNTKADKNETQTALDSKVNASDLVADYYTKTDVDAIINTLDSDIVVATVSDAIAQTFSGYEFPDGLPVVVYNQKTKCGFGCGKATNSANHASGVLLISVTPADEYHVAYSVMAFVPDVAQLQAMVDNLANKSDVDSINSAIDTINTTLDNKANKNELPNLDNYYDKTSIDARFNIFADEYINKTNGLLAPAIAENASQITVEHNNTAVLPTTNYSVSKQIYVFAYYEVGSQTARPNIYVIPDCEAYTNISLTGEVNNTLLFTVPDNADVVNFLNSRKLNIALGNYKGTLSAVLTVRINNATSARYGYKQVTQYSDEPSTLSPEYCIYETPKQVTYNPGDHVTIYF